MRYTLTNADIFCIHTYQRNILRTAVLEPTAASDPATFLQKWHRELPP